MVRSGMLADHEQRGWPREPGHSRSPGCSAAHRKMVVVGEATHVTSADTVYATSCVLLRKSLVRFQYGEMFCVFKAQKPKKTSDPIFFPAQRFLPATV